MSLDTSYKLFGHITLFINCLLCPKLSTTTRFAEVRVNINITFRNDHKPKYTMQLQKGKRKLPTNGNFGVTGTKMSIDFSVR